MSPLGAGIGAALRHRRLAAVLWLSLLFSAVAVGHPFKMLFEPLDAGAFRESLVRGWESWGVLAYTVKHWGEFGVATAAIGGAFLLFALLTIFLTGGVLRALIAGRPRPVFRLVVAEGAALFKANLWATVRYVLTASIWIGLLVVGPHALIAKLAKDTAAPHSFWPTFAFWWTFLVGGLVLLNCGLRFDVARVALARGEAVNARGAYRVAKRRLRGSRPSAIGLALFWLAVAAVVQAVFTSLGLEWNPHTDASTFWLFVVRQFGFFFLAMARVGFWASLLVWEDARRPPV